MAKLTWDNTGERFYETGVKNVALYVFDNTSGAKKYKDGVAWNGVTAVNETPSGGEATDIYADDNKYLSLMSAEKLDATIECYMTPPEFDKYNGEAEVAAGMTVGQQDRALYADDKKYLNLLSAEEFAASIEAYTYPDEFAECDGSASLAEGFTIGQQARSKFALAYKTTIGNDEAGNSLGYKLHIIYNCLAAPSEKSYNTINDSPEAITFSWEISTTPVTFTAEGKEYSTACITIDSRKVNKEKLAALETKLFGGTEPDSKPTLVLPDEIYTTMKQ